MDGRPLSPTWYPVPSKPEYVLAKQTQDSVDREMEQLGLGSPVRAQSNTHPNNHPNEGNNGSNGGKTGSKVSKGPVTLDQMLQTDHFRRSGAVGVGGKKKHLVTYTTNKLSVRPAGECVCL